MGAAIATMKGDSIGSGGYEAAAKF